jgi:hypothetical protein
MKVANYFLGLSEFVLVLIHRCRSTVFAKIEMTTSGEVISFPFCAREGKCSPLPTLIAVLPLVVIIG